MREYSNSACAVCLHCRGWFAPVVTPAVSMVVAPLVLMLAVAMVAAPAAATEILLKDGRVLQGMLGAVASLTDQPAPPNPEGTGTLQMIIFLDDNLRRTWIPKRQVQSVNEVEVGRNPERFVIRQPGTNSPTAVKAVGPIIKITPFDEFGRRIFTFNTSKGAVNVVQGITELTPEWAKVEGLSHVWDSRVATTSIPRDVLHKLLLKQIDPNKLDHHKKIARFYLQAERFEEAAAQLQDMIKRFPNEPGLQADLEPTIRQLRQLGAQRLLAELKLRQQAGQHRLVRSKLDAFPTEGVAGEILQAAREMLQDYQTLESRRAETIRWLDEEIAKISETSVRERIAPIRAEIAAELGVDTLPRMAAFRQNVGDKDLLPTEKVALAVSGWLLGADKAGVKLPVALSAHKVRDLIKQYLNEPVKIERERIFQYFQSEEASAASVVAAILAHMKPPWDPPEPVDAARRPGYYRLEVQVMPKEPAIAYYVQLPPEYNPHRHYPTIITLNGSGTTAEQQVDWWAGAWTEGGWRAGQATRQGYIVVAPDWTNDHQKDYQYSAREHAAVLNTLRDACRRFSIDTDRVFLSGHSIGGDAAWDIALAHPDLWAGVVPVVAESDKFIALYTENGSQLPMYFVFGELDNNKMRRSARDLDRYLKLGFNCTVVEYLGRGHEHFYDEILRIFDWMGRFRRDFFPREFEAKTMRTWDNYFWWVELEGLPPGSMVEPAQWPPRRGTQAAQVKGKINDANGITVTAGSRQVSVWISPKMLDFDKRVSIVVNGRRLNAADRLIQPDLKTLLEDVRTRADRQNPFWLKVDMATGRI